MWSLKRQVALLVFISGCLALALMAMRRTFFTGHIWMNMRQEEICVTPERSHRTLTAIFRAQAQGQPAAERGGVRVTHNVMQVLRVEPFPRWTTSDPHDAVFTRRVYLYSAFLALHTAPPAGRHVDIVAFQEGLLLLDLKCCAKTPGGTPVQGSDAIVVFHPLKILKRLPRSNDLHVTGVVYRCHFPLTAQQLGAGHVTVAAASCPEDEGVYLPVGVPVRRARGLALCGKVAYGHELNPRKLVEWFEVQRLLGVDKILIYDLNNTATVHRIFSHYRHAGLLDLLPYKLPGRKWGRLLHGSSLLIGDDLVTVFDCRLRLAGYDYVIGVDMDEVIMPRKWTRLKPFFDERFKKNDRLAGLIFQMELFAEDWGPVDPKAPLLFLQYLNRTRPRLSRVKYVYKPSRTFQLTTHKVFACSGYRTAIVDPSLATVLHYRKCHEAWKWKTACNPPRITDHTMLRFQDDLVPRVQSTVKRLGL